MRAVTNTNDVAMVFLSGHGITTPDQHYRFLPYDYDPERVERTTISDSELQDYLTKIGGKKIFFFDTCYSGNVLIGARGTDTRPNVDKFANELKAAPRMGLSYSPPPRGTNCRLERDEWNNGAFTKALVEGMRGAAARPAWRQSRSPICKATYPAGKGADEGQSEPGDGDAENGRRLLDRPAAELTDGPLRSQADPVVTGTRARGR